MNRLLFIDIKDAEVNAYIFKRKKGTYEVSDIKRYAKDEKHPFSLDDIPRDIDTSYLSLPLSSLNYRLIDVPFADKNKIREVLPFELNGIILGGSDRVIFDDIIVGSTSNTNQVLAVYVDKDYIRNILDKCTSFSIDPEFITSIELKSIGKDFSLERLLSPVKIDDIDRIPLALEEIKAPTINLRRDEFTYTRDIEETKKSLKITVILTTLIMVIIAAGLLLKIISTRTEIGDIKKEMRKEYQELYPQEKNIVNELYQLKAHMKELKEKEQLLIGVSPLNLLMNLSRIDKHNTFFNEVSIQNKTITLKGEAPSLSDIQHIKVGLEQFFDEVTISNSKTSASGAMIFSITAKDKTS